MLTRHVNNYTTLTTLDYNVQLSLYNNSAHCHYINSSSYCLCITIHSVHLSISLFEICIYMFGSEQCSEQSSVRLFDFTAYPVHTANI